MLSALSPKEKELAELLTVLIDEYEERRYPIRKSTPQQTFLEMRKHDAARESFLKALQYRLEYLPALQGISELLLREAKIDDAAGFVERMLEISPMDSFALSMKAEILWRRGQHGEAIDTMTIVVKAQPENATFLFRLGRFLQQSGLSERAYEYFLRAKASDGGYLDARFSLASAAIDLGKFEEAKTEIEELRDRGPVDKRYVLNAIEAQYYLAVGEIEEAADLARNALNFRRNVVPLGIMAKVEAARARRCEVDGMKVVADSHRRRAYQLLDEGLKVDPSNAALLHQRERLVQDERAN